MTKKKVGWFELKGVDDERDRHPFYSTWAKREWRKKLKELEKEEKSPVSKRRKPIDDLCETPPQEN